MSATIVPKTKNIIFTYYQCVTKNDINLMPESGKIFPSRKAKLAAIEVENFCPSGYSYSMIRKGIILILLLLIFVAWVPFGECKDASFRCGNTFIDVGDSRARVLFKCGDPVQREVIGYIDSRENGDLIEYVMEAWTYDRGTARFHIIIFKGNRVYNIESEMK